MKAARLAAQTRSAISQRTLTSLARQPIRAARPQLSLRSTPAIHCASTQSYFSSTAYQRKGLQPDSENPPPPKTEPHVTTIAAEPAEISDEEYHEKSDEYLERLVLALEEMAETSTEYEIEYASGVMNLTTPNGVYVINKQPPNKQIWLSSPVSGPKRYDFVMMGAGQHEKEGSEDVLDTDSDDGAGGRWVYLRDGSSLTELLEREVSLKLGPRES